MLDNTETKIIYHTYTRETHAHAQNKLITPLEKASENNLLLMKSKKIYHCEETFLIFHVTLFCYSHFTKYTFFAFFFKKIWSIQKKVVPLHRIKKET